MLESHQRALIVAYFLSRFDRKGVRALGYANFTEAFQAIGKLLDVKPNTIKNMRDSFDPYCSPVRVGWYQRTILPSRANVIAAYATLSEEAMISIVREILFDKTNQTQAYLAPLKNLEPLQEAPIDLESTPYASRIETGEKAEKFFIDSFPSITDFMGSSLEDMRKIGLGFDFRANYPSHFSVIEVKGLRLVQGAVSFTDKEWGVAGILGDDYYVALVRAIDTTPDIELIRNPVKSIPIKKKIVESVSITWTTYL